MPDTDQQQHTVVIGGGVAGLAAATYLARGGRAVTVVEKASTLGGRAATDHHNGFALNRGAHALYTGGPGSEVLRELGVSYSYGIPRRLFVLDGRGIHRLPASPLDLLLTTLLDGTDKREVLGLFARLGAIPMARLGELSAAEWIDRTVRRPRVRALVRSIARVYTYSAALDLASADTVVAKLQQTARYPVHYVDGGWQTIVDGLREAALQAGATVRTASGADAIRLDNGRAIAVRLHDDLELPVDNVVLAVPPLDALHLLGSAKAPQLERQVAAMVPVHIACLDVALERLPTARAPVVFDMQQPRFITAQSTVARIAPDGGAVIHLFKQLDPRAPTDPHEDVAELEALLDQVQPGWREVVVERRFLPRMLGSSLLPLATRRGLAGRPAHRSQDVPNIYFAGDWVGPRGYLADASFDSARESAHLILGTAQSQEELRRAA